MHDSLKRRKERRYREQTGQKAIGTQMADLNPIVSIIILNINGPTSQLKDKECQARFKNNKKPHYSTICLHNNFKYKAQKVSV